MRNLFLMNILLALIWAALTGSFGYINIGFGFFVSYGILWVITRGRDDVNYFSKAPQVVSFLLFFIKELVKANIQVAYDVITPKDHMKPGIVAVPLEAKTAMEITLLANFITMTPGTLSLDVSTDRKVLYIHAMYVEDKQAFIDEIKNGFERRLLKILR
ncbi:MAG: Na+/H+ antiporter subunit E [Schleiferiaceae bacterium]|nr:Na+/H+ antiporter subunit E [Schleiferiaceae bacterium]